MAGLDDVPNLVLGQDLFLEKCCFSKLEYSLTLYLVVSSRTCTSERGPAGETR